MSRFAAKWLPLCRKCGASFRTLFKWRPWCWWLVTGSRETCIRINQCRCLVQWRRIVYSQARWILGMTNQLSFAKDLENMAKRNRSIKSILWLLIYQPPERYFLANIATTHTVSEGFNGKPNWVTFPYPIGGSGDGWEIDSISHIGLLPYLFVSPGPRHQLHQPTVSV